MKTTNSYFNEKLRHFGMDQQFSFWWKPACRRAG